MKKEKSITAGRGKGGKKKSILWGFSFETSGARHVHAAGGKSTEKQSTRIFNSYHASQKGAGG
jgi:hypothetical protein